MSDVLHRDLLESWLEDSLPRSLLISGRPGIGKKAFAQALGRRLLGAEETVPVHPDLFVAAPNEELKTRPVDIKTIRALIGSFALSSVSGRRVGLILDADRMTEEAANAVLKTLEEPRPDCHLILTATEPWALPATIRSRLIIRELPMPMIDEALAFMNDKAPTLADESCLSLLRLAGGAPLAALGLVEAGEDISKSVAAIAKLAAEQKFDRAKALNFAETAAKTNWETAANLILRFLHLAALAKAGETQEPAHETEKTALQVFTFKAPTARIIEAWRLASDLRKAADDQALTKSLSLYRMCLAFEWVMKGA